MSSEQRFEFTKDNIDIYLKELAKEYLEKFTELAEETGLSVNLPVTEITKLPDVLTIRETDDDEEVIENELMECLKTAIDNFGDGTMCEEGTVSIKTKIAKLNQMYTLDGWTVA